VIENRYDDNPDFYEYTSSLLWHSKAMQARPRVRHTKPRYIAITPELTEGCLAKDAEEARRNRAILLAALSLPKRTKEAGAAVALEKLIASTIADVRKREVAKRRIRSWMKRWGFSTLRHYRSENNSAHWKVPLVGSVNTADLWRDRYPLDSFMQRKSALGRKDLIFPILYIRVPALDVENQWRDNPILNVIGSRQYIDWRSLRHLDVNSTEVKKQVEWFCEKIAMTLHQPWISLEQRKTIKEETRQRAEQERRRQEAETQRQTEEDRRRKKAETEAQRGAEEELSRKELEAQQRAEEQQRGGKEAKETRHHATDAHSRQEGETRHPSAVDHWVATQTGWLRITWPLPRKTIAVMIVTLALIAIFGISITMLYLSPKLSTIYSAPPGCNDQAVQKQIIDLVNAGLGREWGLPSKPLPLFAFDDTGIEKRMRKCVTRWSDVKIEYDVSPEGSVRVTGLYRA
jgi:hypothetical protein